jgi:hypothetical protein
MTVAALGTAAVWLDHPESDHTVTGDLGTHEDPTRGFAIDYPETWHRAATTLTPRLTDPVEIVSLGTGDLPAGGDACVQFPVAALEALNPTDALITIEERLSPQAAGLSPGQPWDDAAGFPPRPQEFPPSGSKNISEVVDCLAAPPTFDHWWFAFNDAGRAFHVLVAIGTQASGPTRAETWAILDSFRVDPYPEAATPAVEGLTLGQAQQALQQAGLQGGPADGDPTATDALVVAQEPPADTAVSHGDAVGLRTALITPDICDRLRRLPDFSDGAHWDLPLDALSEISDIAGPPLHDDAQLVMDHITRGDDIPTTAATRALDRIVIHQRACN